MGIVISSHCGMLEIKENLTKELQWENLNVVQRQQHY